MIATVGFGMGVDVPDLTRVIHWGIAADPAATLKATCPTFASAVCEGLALPPFAYGRLFAPFRCLVSSCRQP